MQDDMRKEAVRLLEPVMKVGCSKNLLEVMHACPQVQQHPPKSDMKCVPCQ